MYMTVFSFPERKGLEVASNDWCYAAAICNYCNIFSDSVSYENFTLLIANEHLCIYVISF